MKRSPKLRPNLWDGILAVLVVAMAVGSGIAIWGGQDQSEVLTVVVSVDGEEVECCPLEQFPDQDQIYTGNGYTLTVGLSGQEASKPAGIRVEMSDCPTQDCVHTGTISRAGQSIVCLPARIIILLEGTAVSDDGPDLVVG